MGCLAVPAWAVTRLIGDSPGAAEFLHEKIRNDLQRLCYAGLATINQKIASTDKKAGQPSTNQIRISR